MDERPSISKRERLKQAAELARQHAKIQLLHVRYVLGYLAAGFGVSAPVTLGYQVYYGQDAREMMALTGLSVAYGVALFVPFIALEPVTRIAWERMRVPEFRMFELAVSRSAAIVSFALFAVSMVRPGAISAAMIKWMPPGLFWTVFVLMGTAWGKIRAQVFMFPEFYADAGGERVLQITPPPSVPPPPPPPPQAEPPR